MKHTFKGWEIVAQQLHILTNENTVELNHGQKASLLALVQRLPNNGVIIADEVGMGKTRIAATLARSVIAAGGRVAILVPPGLGYQWSSELQTAGVSAPPILRSLDGFLNAWEAEDNNSIQPWADQNALLISHAFCNWQVKSNTKRSWTWSLLPKTLALIQANLLRESGKLPKGTKSHAGLNDDARITGCAHWIIQHTPEQKLKDIANRDGFNRWGSESPLLKPDSYLKHTEYRRGLENVIGFGLGDFDLVIIDEAHKNRGTEGNLERLLKHVVATPKHARYLAMTATPVELDATQWGQMLDRIRVEPKAKASASAAIADYAQAVAKVRQCPSDAGARATYQASATAFKQALNDYLLRRDKRADPAIVQFQAISGEAHHAYRCEQEILIDTAQLSAAWKQGVCAAEALSFVTRQSDHSPGKRLRLTLGNGHGIASLIDQLQRDDKDDHKQTEADSASENTQNHAAATVETATDKRLLRAAWWQEIMLKPFTRNDGSALFDHPAILAAVEAIEAICQQGEKVLVFGRFTRPLRALVQLLNAREMLRCIDTNKPWPQSKIHENDNRNAILAAHRQLARQDELDFQTLNDALANQYQKIENQRREIREKLISRIEAGFHSKQADERVQMLFKTFKQAATDISGQANADDHVLAVVARAIQELMDVNAEDATPADYAQAFMDLLAAASDRDEGDTNGDGQLDEEEATNLWAKLNIRLHEEYNRPEGGYARLMYGETKPETRRFLQLAFNRKQGHPKVLVAQSLVGREGLNLHKACRTVVLLHPEWNPGVVEQQIGRVDRIGSLWEAKLAEFTPDEPTNAAIPRILIRPVVFQGTYDEKNWQVLHERWDDLRAQLHGIVISPRIAGKYLDAEEIINDINNAAPNFSPPGCGDPLG